MQDFLHIPNSKDNIQTFYATGSIGWEIWSRPSNAKFISIFCLGGGAGGGAGYSNSSNLNTSSGGGAGASSGYTRAIYPVSILPDILYVQVGAEGAGGLPGATTGSNGTAGGNSFVSLAPSTAAVNLLAAANTNAPGGGSGGSTASGNAGTVPTIWVLTASPFTVLGIVQPVVGLVGVGGTLSAGTSSTALNTNFISQGAGGGGKTTNTVAHAGGSVNAAPILLVNTVNGGIAGGGNGNSGYGLFAPICSTGGAGGGGNITAGGIGGRGGDGWYGAGGGGGGAGQTGGRGGKGGDGLVIITTIF